jgi:molybdopterin molybdotransferase
MSQAIAAPQRIARLAPLREVHAALDRLAAAAPVKARTIALAAASGRVLAADAIAASAGPAAAVALRDGWAIEAAAVADAGPYAPVPLVTDAAWVDAGDVIPPGADAVLPPDAVMINGGVQEAIASVAPGEGIVPASADFGASQPIRHAGEQLRATDVAVLALAGLAHVDVRAPRLRIVSSHPGADEAHDHVAPLLAAAVAAAGGEVEISRASAQREALERALADDSCDAVIAIGGTGAGRSDRSVRVLAGIGQVHVHGMGIRPGETAALGTVGSRPVLLVPGRLDAALATWLLVGRRLLARLTGAIAHDVAVAGKLSRKIVSTVGIAEMVLVRRSEGGLDPIGGESLPLHQLAIAAGWVLVPPESEGYPAGAAVDVRPLP